MEDRVTWSWCISWMDRILVYMRKFHQIARSYAPFSGAAELPNLIQFEWY